MNDYDERWRPIRHFIGLYEVSNFGRIRSVARIVAARDGERLIEGRILMANPGVTTGYPKVVLCNGAHQKDVNVHKLVAEAFVAGTGQLIRHLDGNKLNNHYKNLAWGSCKDNEADKLRHGRRPMGEAHPNSKMTDGHVRSMRELHSRGFNQLQIAAALGLNRGVVGTVVRGEGWTHVSS